jgi:Holliday junction resolvasome RuvABC endonuclease subunit
MILGIDPGTKISGYALWGSKSNTLVHCGVVVNREIKDEEYFNDALMCADVIAIEMIGHYGTGMSVGRSVFATCIFIGRLLEQLQDRNVKLILRPSVKASLCGTARAKDANVIQALKDLIGEKGTKKNPGPLYGIKSHAWQALALAVAVGRGDCKEVDLDA